MVLTFDRSAAEDFWLSREYLPHAHDLWGSFETTLAEPRGVRGDRGAPSRATASDGFFHAFWQRPHAYLDGSITDAMAVFQRLDERETQDGLRRLSEDLEAGTWQARHADLSERDTIDLGYRLLVSRL